jgi:hypothetical protein
MHAPNEDKIDHTKDTLYEELKCVFDQFPKYHMNIFVIRFQCRSWQRRYFKPTIGNESLHKISSNNEVRVVYFATSKNLILKNTMFPHHNNHKFTWTSPDRKMDNQIDHI